MRLINVSLPVLLALLFLGGCVSERKKVESIRPVLPKLKDYNLSLEIPKTRRILSAAKDPQLTFMLRNLGKKKVDLVEWQVDETRNVHYYYRPYDPKITAFDPRDPGWKEYLPKQSANPHYSVLEMTSHNRVFIPLPVPFINEPGVYMVVGELLMTAVDVRSEITTVEVTK